MSETSISQEYFTNLTGVHTAQLFHVLGAAKVQGVVDYPMFVNDAAIRPATSETFDVLEKFRIAEERSNTGSVEADVCEELYQIGLPVRVAFQTENEETDELDGAILGVYGDVDAVSGGVFVCVAIPDAGTVWPRDAVIYPTSPAHMGIAYAC